MFWAFRRFYDGILIVGGGITTPEAAGKAAEARALNPSGEMTFGDPNRKMPVSFKKRWPRQPASVPTGR